MNGIVINRTAKGTPKSITFDLKRYGEKLLKFCKESNIDLGNVYELSDRALNSIKESKSNKDRLTALSTNDFFEQLKK